jgi:hypothetical protein
MYSILNKQGYIVGAFICMAKTFNKICIAIKGRVLDANIYFSIVIKIGDLLINPLFLPTRN